MLYLFDISYPVFYVLERSFVGDIIHQHNSLFTTNNRISKRTATKAMWRLSARWL